MKQGNRIIRTLKLKNNAKGRGLEVEVYYNIGGMNYFTGNEMPRGIYLSVTPVTRGEGFTEFTAFSGTCIFVKPLKRFSAKVLASFVPDESDIKKLIDHVLAKNNLELA